tara:strand:+ start:4269 stop:5243 length:975 start_codon:yes stop_codon:yes gene_type:complete
LLESVEFLSQLKSNRASNDRDLINNHSEYSSIIAKVDLSHILKIELLRIGAKKVYVNDCLLKKQGDIKNYIRSVCFNSDDIYIVKGEPKFRRNWLDKVVSQLEPVYVELLSRYNRLLKQRSHYWRSEITNNSNSDNLIESFDSQLALAGTRIYRRRNRALNKLKPYIQNWHKQLSFSKEITDLNYISSIQISSELDNEKEIMDIYLSNLRQKRQLEAITGKCMVGPHRDDVEFFINDYSIKKYASSGQQRTITLALKMAELDLLSRTLSINPILILDDVLAELDVVRQNLLLSSAGKNCQCFISATHLDKFNKSFLDTSQIIHL